MLLLTRLVRGCRRICSFLFFVSQAWICIGRGHDDGLGMIKGGGGVVYTIPGSNDAAFLRTIVTAQQLEFAWPVRKCCGCLTI